MDLEFTEEQEFLRDTVANLLAEHSTPEIVRDLEDDPVGYRRELWDQLAALDLIGLSLPAEHGGSGMGSIETVILYEELGRAATSSPHLVSAVLAGGLIAAAASDEQKQDWLPRIASGETIVSVAWQEPGGGEGPDGIRLTAAEDGDGHRLDGTKFRVPFAEAAGTILTLARTGDDPRDVSLFLVGGDADGLEITHTLVMAADAEHQVRYDGVAVPASARLGPGGGGWNAFEAVMADVLIAVSAFAIGGAERALEMAVQYAKEREQFGKPIGSFQGLAHPIADMATEITGAKVLVYQAAWARAQDHDLGPLAHMAKYYAADVFKRTTKWAQQVWGGMGFTREVDVQLYFRRAKQLELTWFSPGTLEDVVAAAELDGEAGFVGIDAGV